jgi:hypothetical protein
LSTVNVEESKVMSSSDQAQPQTPPPPKPGDDDYVLGAGIDFADPHSPLAPLYGRYSLIVAAAMLGLLFAVISHFPVWHTDVWAHLRFGEEIVRQRGLPAHENFAETFADKEAPYIHYQWLAQAGAYLVFDLGRTLASDDADHRLGGGATFLAATHALILTLRFLVLTLAFWRLTKTLPFSLLGIALVLAMTFFNHLWILRPQILGEFGFALLLLVLSRPVLSRWALVLVPLLFVVWTNCHGSVLVGFVLLGVALAGQALEMILQGGSLRQRLSALIRDPQTRRLAAVTFLSLAGAALLNPHGPWLFLYSWRLSNHPNIQFMEEWKPLPVKGLSGYVFLASVLILAPLLRWSPRRFTPAQVLLLAVFGLQSLAHARVLVWWIMVFAWVVVPHLQATGRRYLPRFLVETDTPDLKKTILAGLAAVALFLWSGPAVWLLWGDVPNGPKCVNGLTPLETSRFLTKEYEEHPELPRCVFADETMGDFLVWDLRREPAVRIFAYTHVHLLTPDHWLECMAVKSGDRNWQAILDRHQVQFLVVDKNLHENLVRQVRAASERWQVVSDKPVFVARRKPATEVSP